MTPQDWIEGTKKPAYIDHAIHGTQDDSVYGFKYPFVQEGVRLMTSLIEERNELRATVEKMKAERVVVPELTAEDIEKHLHETMPMVAHADPDSKEVEWCFKDCRWTYNLAASRVPASRVFKDGEVAVPVDKLRVLLKRFIDLSADMKLVEKVVEKQKSTRRMRSAIRERKAPHDPGTGP